MKNLFIDLYNYFSESCDPLVNAKCDRHSMMIAKTRDLSGTVGKKPMPKINPGNDLVQTMRMIHKATSGRKS